MFGIFNKSSKVKQSTESSLAFSEGDYPMKLITVSQDGGRKASYVFVYNMNFHNICVYTFGHKAKEINYYHSVIIPVFMDFVKYLSHFSPEEFREYLMEEQGLDVKFSDDLNPKKSDESSTLQQGEGTLQQRIDKALDERNWDELNRLRDESSNN